MSGSYFRISRRLGMRFRLWRSRLKNSTLRLKISGLPSFYAGLDKAGVKYVVLRWSDEVPTTITAEAGYSEDIDHLIENGALDSVFLTSLRQPGKMKCDFYSVSGERGSAYRRMPYYMPEMARKILERRVRHPKGFFVPEPKDAYFSFIYHLIYHKGPRSGIETGLSTPTCADAKRNYSAEVVRLAEQCDMPLPEPFTLLGFHEYLKQFGWNMSADLLLRWPDRHPVIEALVEFERVRLGPEMTAAENMTVFMLREDCVGAAAESVARNMIASRFAILEEVRLEGSVRDRVVFRTRGGNWTEKGQSRPTLPTLAFVCRNSAQPEPLKVSMSPRKLKARYPHVENTDVLIKRAIRDEVARLEGIARRATVIHATDNAFETAETLRALYGENTGPHLARLVASLPYSSG